MMRALLLIACLLAAPAAAAEAPEVDHLALAAVLLRDGHPARAARVLDEVDLDDDALDHPRYFTLRGVIALRQQDFRGALDALDAAVEAGATDPALHLFRARSAYALDDCPTALDALDRAGPAVAEGGPDMYVIPAECHWRAGRHARALGALDAGEAAHPSHRGFARTRVQRLVELGLFQAAVEAGRAFVAGGAAAIEDHLFVSEALLRAGEPAEARALLEEARLIFGDDERILVQLGHAWLGAEHPITGARMFARAALYDPAYSRDAAEIFREQRMFARALALNGRLFEQPVKLRQRLALLLDMERFEAAAALEPRLSRLGLLTEDEELRYALAYARFRLGDFAAAERHLRRLRSPGLFERAGQLRKAMADCRAGVAQCD